MDGCLHRFRQVFLWLDGIRRIRQSSRLVNIHSNFRHEVIITTGLVLPLFLRDNKDMNLVYAAAVDWISNDQCKKGLDFGGTDKGAASIQCLEPLFQNVIQGLAALVGIALFIMILNSGFRYLTSAGDPKKLEAARGSLTNAIVGVVVIAIGYLILKTIQVFVFTGSDTDITIFKILPFE